MNKVKEQEITIEKLKFWFEHDLNVMLVGRHGVGKTQKMLKALEELGLVLGESFLYFSASTLDPWVDFVGVPKETTVDGETFLDLVRPRIWKDNIQVIILDEFNRAPKKVRNAVMELVQFKSINGMKINNLKCVWVAENPSDEDDNTYDVEQTDPAQRDRFQVQINVPYKLDKPFFIKTFGKDVYISINEWWNSLSAEDKNYVSPRRVEYILNHFKINGDLRDLGLPMSVNMTRLKSSLDRTSPVSTRMVEFYRKRDKDGARIFINNENNYNSCIGRIAGNSSYAKFYVPLLAEEKIASLLSKSTLLRGVIVDLSIGDVRISTILKNVRKTSPSSKVAQDIKRRIAKLGGVRIKDALTCSRKDLNANAKLYYSKVNSILLKDKLESRIKEVQAGIQNDAYSSPYSRRSAFKRIGSVLYKDFTEEHALACLEIFEYLMKRTHNSTVSQKWNDPIRKVNTVFAALYQLGFDFKKIIDKIDHVIDFIAYEGTEKFFFEV